MDYASCSSSKQPSMAANNGGKDKKKSVKKGKAVKLSTDPQSVAARERRHRISDRFKILQSLVPGGSKMDTVSMLEEAIQYVKFLKTQIWLHQAMINYADYDPTSLFSPINGCEVPLPDPHQQTTTDMYSPFNLDAQVHAMPPQVGFQDYYLQEEEIMPFDAQMMY